MNELVRTPKLLLVVLSNSNNYRSALFYIRFKNLIGLRCTENVINTLIPFKVFFFAN